MKIRTISLKYLTSDELFSFIKKIIMITEEIGLDKLKISLQVNNILIPAFEKLGKVCSKSRKSKFTADIAEIFNEIKETKIAMTSFVSVMKVSDNEDEAKASKNIEFIFDEFKGMLKNSRNIQSSKIRKLVKLLRSECFEDCKKIGLEKWIDKLERLNKEMILIMSTRIKEKAEKRKFYAAEVRKEVVSAYRILCKHIEVSAATEGLKNYDEFIRNLNALIGEFSTKRTNRTDHETISTENTDILPQEMPES